MHCHPWNKPPLEEETNEKNSMLCNLSNDLQYKKLSALHNTIVREYGITPVPFKSGRWGYSQGIAESLRKLQYKIDTSVSQNKKRSAWVMG
jgi:hypothetical protein